MRATVAPSGQWVRLAVTASGFPRGARCRLIVVAADGQREQAGSWTVAASRGTRGRGVGVRVCGRADVSGARGRRGDRWRAGADVPAGLTQQSESAQHGQGHSGSRVAAAQHTSVFGCVVATAFADARTTAREKGQQPMSAYGLGLGLGMTSIAAAVARGSAVDVVPAGGDAASMAAPAVAYATTGGRIATGAGARRRAIGSPDRLVSRVLHDVARGSSVSAGDSADAGFATRSRADDPVRALRAMVQGVITAVAAGQGGDPARLTVTHPTPWSAGPGRRAGRRRPAGRTRWRAAADPERGCGRGGLHRGPSVGRRGGGRRG